MVEEVIRTFNYKKSKLYLNYSVSDKIVQMIREASSSISIIGYKFVPNCDESLDIFLALHELGIRCTREKRHIMINMGVDYRTGIAKATYRASDVAGLDYLASLQKIYPYLTVNVAKVVHSARDTLHSKAVTVDNLTMIKSGEGSLLNGRGGTQRENGILFRSNELANHTALAIKSNIEKPNSERINIRADVQKNTLPPVLIDRYSPIKIHENDENDENEKILSASRRLSQNLYKLAHLDSKIFNRRALDIFTVSPPFHIEEKTLYIYVEEDILKYKTVTSSGSIVEGNLTTDNLSLTLYNSIKNKAQLPSDHSHKRLTKVEVNAFMAVISKNNHHFQYVEYKDFKKISEEFKEDIDILQTKGGTNLLRQMYHNNQDAFLARQRWIEMMLKMEAELNPITETHAKMIKNSWEEGKGLDAVHEELKLKHTFKLKKITEKDAGKALTRIAVECQGTLLKTTSSLLREAIDKPNEKDNTLLNEDSEASSASRKKNEEEITNNATVSSEENYRFKVEALKIFLSKLPNTRKEIQEMPKLKKAELFLAFEYHWNKLTIAFNQLKQAGQYKEKIDFLTINSTNNQLSEERKLLSFLNACCGGTEGQGYGDYGSEYDELCKKIQSFNQSIDDSDEKSDKKSDKKADLLNQSASFMPNFRSSIYKTTLLKQINQLVSGDVINIAVSNINDPDIINCLARACNSGVIIRIAIGKYMNNFIENLPGGGGSNSKAIAKLTQLIDEKNKINLQVRWLVFLENNQKSIGSTKFQQGIHRKYLSIHKQKNDSREEEHIAFVGSSPLDVQAQFYSAELDVVINDKDQVTIANHDLFQREYNSGIDMHFCLAIESLKKAGFPNYAEWQYNRHINQIELDGKDGKISERINIKKELNNFIITQKDKVKGKYFQHLKKTEEHLNHFAKYSVYQSTENTSDVLSKEQEEREEIEKYLTNFSLSLDQYKQGKHWSSKKYENLLNELKKEPTLIGIKMKIIERIKKSSGLFSYFKMNSFAFHLAKNGVLDTHEGLVNLSKDNNYNIVKILNRNMKNEKLPYSIFGNNKNLLFTDRKDNNNEKSNQHVYKS